MEIINKMNYKVEGDKVSKRVIKETTIKVTQAS